MVISLGKNVALTAGQALSTGKDGTPQIASLGSPQLGYPQMLAVGFEVDAGITVTVQVSFDNGQTWLPASYRGTPATAAVVAFSVAGAAYVEIIPAPYVRLLVNGTCKITAWAYVA